MTSLALFVGLFMTTVGLVGIVAPDGLLRAAHYTVTPIGLYLVAALRVSFGVVLLLAASASRAPKALRVLGYILLLNGLVTPLVGVERARVILDWWAAQGTGVMRLWAGFAVALGVFVAYAVAAGRRAT